MRAATRRSKPRTTAHSLIAPGLNLISRCEILQHRMMFITEHERARKHDAQTDGDVPISFLDRGSRIELLSRVSGPRDHFCSYGQLVTIWADWARPDVCAHAF